MDDHAVSAPPSRWRFFALLGLAVALFNIPILRAPFNWFETYCHEMSHGLAAVLTGGSIQNLVLRLDGSGLLWSAGSFFPSFVSFAGYSGAIGAGTVLYLASSRMEEKYAKIFALLAAGGVFISGFVFYGGHIAISEWVITALITSLMSGCLFALYRLGSNRIVKGLMQFTGLYVVIAGCITPLYQLGATQSDAVTLAGQTFLPVLFWVGLWVLLGVCGLYLCYRKR